MLKEIIVIYMKHGFDFNCFGIFKNQDNYGRP